MPGEITPGSRVRVLINRVGASVAPGLAHAGRYLQPGDVISVFGLEGLSHGGNVTYQTVYGGINYIPIRDVELLSEVCTCDVLTLILEGSCVCGRSGD